MSSWLCERSTHDKWKGNCFFYKTLVTALCLYKQLCSVIFCIFQQFGAILKRGYKAGNWPSPSSLRRKTAAAGPTTPTAVESSCWPDNRIQGILGPIWCGSKLTFLPSTRSGLRGHPFMVLQGQSHRQSRRSTSLMRLVKYWDKLPASDVTAPSIDNFKKRLEQSWTEYFPYLLVQYNFLLNTHRSNSIISVSICSICDLGLLEYSIVSNPTHEELLGFMLRWNKTSISYLYVIPPNEDKSIDMIFFFLQIA